MSRLGEGAGDEHIGRRDLAEWRSGLGRGLARLAVWSARFLAAQWVLVLIAAIGAVAAVGLTAVSAELYEGVLDQEGLALLDRPVLDAAIALRTPQLNETVTWFTHLGGPLRMTLLTAAAVVAMTLAWRSWTPAVLVLIAVTGSLTMTVVGKSLTGRVRPPRADAVPPFETSASFPSGHALNSVVIAGLVAYLLIRKQKSTRARAVTIAVAVGFAVAMGLSRVYLGHHWLTDVVVAWTLGLAWLSVVITAHRLYLTVRRARADGR